LHPDDREDARKYWSSRLRTGEGGEHSYRVRSTQGDYRWFLTRFEPLRASDGTLLLWVGATLDIEELMRAQEALRESERSSRSAIDGIAGLFAILAPNGEVETVNRQVFEYFGRSLEWLKNWGTNDAVHPEDLPRVIELVKRDMASGILTTSKNACAASTANIGGLKTAASQFEMTPGASRAGTFY